MDKNTDTKMPQVPNAPLYKDMQNAYSNQNNSSNMPEEVILKVTTEEFGDDYGAVELLGCAALWGTGSLYLYLDHEYDYVGHEIGEHKDVPEAWMYRVLVENFELADFEDDTFTFTFDKGDCELSPLATTLSDLDALEDE